MPLNANTGIEYELTVALHLIRGWGVRGPGASRIEGDLAADPRRERIEGLAANLGSTGLAESLRERLALDPILDLDLISQDDGTPGDLLVTSGGKRRVEASVSVKYGTRVSRNPTGRLFVSEEFIERMERELVERTIPAYVEEMERRHGEPAAWFRRRKTSRTANEFVGRIVEEACRTWAGLPAYRRRRVVQECLQYGSRVPYLTVILRRDCRGFDLDDGGREHFLMDVERVALAPSDRARQTLEFRHATEGTIARMQVKFNNGILEPARGGGPGPEIRLSDGTRCRPGHAFSSWNFQTTRGTR